MTDETYLDLAYSILRKVQGGKEPYAAAVLPMVSALHELLRDPAVVLAAAEAIIREARIEYIEPLYRELGDPEDGVFLCASKERGISTPQPFWNEGSGTCVSLHEAYKKLEAARRNV